MFSSVYPGSLVGRAKERRIFGKKHKEKERDTLFSQNKVQTGI
jgi:hypothetical protein